MALSPVTPRDRMQRLADLGRKALRYWWLVAAFSVAGAGLTLAFAITKSRSYQSGSTLFYQERIQSQLLSQNREESAQRNIGDKYRELLVARPQLEAILSDPKLNPYPDVEDVDVAIDMLRGAVRLEARGGNAFRILYSDAEPERAKLVVDKLTKMLQDKDESLRNEQARATVDFVTTQKEESAKELRKQQQALAEFLAKHPEFAQDQNVSSEGAGIRARNSKPVASGNTRLMVLERQKQRIQARLDAPPDAPPIRTPAPATPERIAAEAAVGEAQREVQAANRELEDALSKFTNRHPTVIKAQERVAAALQRLRHAQAAVPPDVETTVAPATPQDRAKLQKELQQLEQQIADAERNTKGTQPAADTSTNWVVQLETQHADLRRAVAEQRERVGALADSVFRAQMDANQKLAEQGGRLLVVDPASKPVRPSGTGKTMFLLVGMVLFVGLGLGLAIGMAVIDDRLYRRSDLDQLGIAVLAVIPPARHAVRRPKQA